METKCDYCDSFYDDTLEKCPNCGATNNYIRRISEGIPRTIEELQQYVVSHNVPVQQMHFYIGVNYTGPRAYGIYRDGVNVIVYKNKADGSRAVRYSGRDEAYAVNEIYQKMRTEYNGHKEVNMNRPPQRNYSNNRRRKSNYAPSTVIGVLIFVFVLLFLIIASSDSDSRGYYRYNNDYYYHQNSSWYLYNTLTDSWEYSSAPADDMKDYYSAYSFDSDYGIEDFEDSGYYESSSSSSYDDDDSSWSSSWDDDDDWDSGSNWNWDSGSNWNSNW